MQVDAVERTIAVRMGLYQVTEAVSGGVSHGRVPTSRLQLETG
jgi:hypothetical protein